ncbi:nuclear pore protein [Blumeria hordei DH14]|uniref:Nuclear pore protein n=1 Tax=Blumeria graminis f. sp. hordei (strain DH14) TaxID=546991 RepID=N1J4X8_BLUG1|nr:nuclear pore protein [Blumeria hordei DH14]
MDEILLNTDPSAFHLLQHGHRDMVSATAFNSYGNRFGTGSVDGTLERPQLRDPSSIPEHLCFVTEFDCSYLVQIQWLPATIYPNLIATLAADGKFRIWAEDPTIEPGSGKRFNPCGNEPVFELRSISRSPFLSFTISHHHKNRHTFLALINRSATVVVYENDEPENLESWNEIDSFTVCEKPARGEEISFRVAFDPNLQPAYTAILEGVPKDALGLVVASMYTASVWRTREITHTISLGSTNSKEFYRAVDLKGHKGLVRDVAWAPGNIRGHDVIATACKDGFIRVFQVLTPPSNKNEVQEETQTCNDSQLFDKTEIIPQFPDLQISQVPSGIGAGLMEPHPPPDKAEEHDIVAHISKEVSLMAPDDSRLPPWKVEFDSDGHLLGSTGDDGKVTLWQREPNGESWGKYSQLVMARDTCA